MKRGDMAQLDEDQQIDSRLRQTLAIGGAMILMLLLSTLIGVFLGFMIWGI